MYRDHLDFLSRRGKNISWYSSKPIYLKWIISCVKVRPLSYDKALIWFLEYMCILFLLLFRIRRYSLLCPTCALFIHHLYPFNRHFYKQWCVLSPWLLLTDLHDLTPAAQEQLRTPGQICSSVVYTVLFLYYHCSLEIPSFPSLKFILLFNL